MILYHGSNVAIERIDLSKSRPFKDFGRAFYLSPDEQQAWERAVAAMTMWGGSPCVTAFEFDETLMSSGKLNVKTFEAYTEEWADFIFANRNRRNPPWLHDYDIVYGPVANDKVYAAFALYEGGLIDKQQLIIELKTYKLVDQYLFHTDNALSLLTFIESKEVKL